MKNLIVFILVFFGFTNVFADCCGGCDEDPVVKIGGSLSVGVISKSQSGAKDDQKRMSGQVDNMAQISSASLTADISGESKDLGLKYGAKLGFTPLHKKGRGNPTYLYLDTAFGKIEIGAGRTVMSEMMQTGWAVSCGVGESWSSYVNLDPNEHGIGYLSDSANNLDYGYRAGGVVEFSRKVSYISPRIHGLQVGISYIPDTSNNGSSSPSADIKNYRDAGIESVYSARTKDGEMDLKKINQQDINRKDLVNALAGGVNYEYQVSDDVKVSVAVVGEYAKANNPLKDPENKDVDLPKEKAKEDLLNFVVGGKLTYKDLSLAASYGNAGKSYSSEFHDGKEEDRYTSGYDLGLKYQSGDLATSLNYYHGDAKGNKLNSYSIGADYSWAPGLTPYIQAVKYDSIGKYKDTENEGKITEDKTGSGYLFVIGTKLKF